MDYNIRCFVLYENIVLYEILRLELTIGEIHPILAASRNQGSVGQFVRHSTNLRDNYILRREPAGLIIKTRPWLREDKTEYSIRRMVSHTGVCE